MRRKVAKLEGHHLFIKTLTLKNIATFDTQVIQFDTNFNVIIGETGSGKSLILDAFQIIFGQRADKKIIRKDEDFAVVEVIFDCRDSKVNSYLNEIGHPVAENNEVILKRIIYKNDTNKSFLNLESCTLQVLQNFSRKFIDLVGQFENQKLLSSSYQLKLLDRYAQLGPLLQDYQALYAEREEVRKKLEALIADKESLEQKADYLDFQVSEIEKLSPSVEDEAELILKKSNQQNQGRKQKIFQEVQALIHSETEQSSMNLLGISRRIESLCSKNKDIVGQNIGEKINHVVSMVEDLSYEVQNILESSQEFTTEEEFEEVLARLDSYQKLKRKFGGTTEAMLLTYEQLRTELSSIQNVDEEIQSLEKQLSLIQHKAFALAEKLHSGRLQFSKRLSALLTENVRELNMPDATIQLSLKKLTILGPTGISDLDFLAETNLGEGTFKVKDIASGGELSRILLALRQAMASNDSISIFLFDEVDTGVGGETANSIGKALGDVAEFSQVIAITHLPQVAQFAQKIIYVSKKTKKEGKGTRTYSHAQEYTGKSTREIIKQLIPVDMTQ